MRKSVRGRRVMRVALAFAVAWPPLAWAAARGLLVSAPLERADALVVLAGSSAYVERAQRAAELFAEGRAPRVLLTNDNLRGGWSEAEQRNPLFVERAAEELRRAGVPPASIEIIGRPVASTHEEAVVLREYAAARGMRSLLVVTSGYHSRRALWTFRRVLGGSGVECGLEAVAPGRQLPRPSTWWLSRIGWKTVAGEYFKLVYYRLSYR